MEISHISGNINKWFYFILSINYILNKHLNLWFSVNLHSLCCFGKHTQVIFHLHNVQNIKLYLESNIYIRFFNTMKLKGCFSVKKILKSDPSHPGAKQNFEKKMWLLHKKQYFHRFNNSYVEFSNSNKKQKTYMHLIEVRLD